jgi:hypothetical protein
MPAQVAERADRLSALAKGIEVKALLVGQSAEPALRAEFPQVRWLFFEPDVEK